MNEIITHIFKDINCTSNNCNNNGICIDGNVCQCFSNYVGEYCATPFCTLSNQCSQHGSCITSDTCICDSNWSGQFCNQPLCPLLNNCSSHGVCIDVNTCKCDNGWTSQSDCSESSCDTHPCENGGTCIGPNQCSCTSDWHGKYCNQPLCPDYCSNRGVCKQPNTCECYSEFQGSVDCSTCSNNTWGEFCIPCPQCVHGHCNALNGECECDSINWTGTLCNTCSYKYYGDKCEPLTKVLQIVPTQSPLNRATLVQLEGHNYDNKTNYSCLFGSTKVKANFVSNELLNCLSPNVTVEKTEVFQLISEQNSTQLIKNSFSFAYFPACLPGSCGEVSKKGKCNNITNQCVCAWPWFGAQCDLIKIAPKFESVLKIQYVNELSDFSFIYSFNSSISLPSNLSLRLIQAPDELKLSTENSSLYWNKVQSQLQLHSIILQAENEIGVDTLSFSLQIIPIYYPVLNETVNRINSSCIRLSGLIKFENTSSQNTLGVRLPVVLFLQSTFYNSSSFKITLESDENGFIYYDYRPAAKEFGQYRASVFHPYETLNLDYSNPQLSFDILGN